MFAVLKRNPTISRLRLCRPEHNILSNCYSTRLEFPEPPVHLPNLRRFDGPSNFVCAFTPGLLTHITILWERLQISTSPCTSQIISLLNPGIVRFVNIVHEWNPSLVSLIACHIPGLEQLIIRRASAYMDINSREKARNFLPYVEEALPSFFSLTALHIHMGITNLYEEDLDLDEEFQIVRRWAEKSSTLLSVTLPMSNTCWIRKDGVWFPELQRAVHTAKCWTAMQPDTLRHFKWFFRTVVTSPSLPAEYNDFATWLVGRQAMLVVRDKIENTGDLPDFEFIQGPDNSLESLITFLVSDSTPSNGHF
ncbi:hypothetical protein GGX14DRAFT_396559 [Mycena pura]|uniref:Uncharacterized protein n=1 Tax=Mycena pura TaxID=153505 RepID=A0AAD6VAK6_9AGAR|nr:hypothetical protein GGX14DRAFT_396559 [Mycena pura]